MQSHKSRDMKLITIILFSIFAFQFPAAQSQDSILFTIIKIKSAELTGAYKLRAWNTSTKPYCIYHSAHILPQQIPPPLLPIFSQTDSTEEFRLSYSLKDAERDHFYEGDYLNGFILLPYQTLEFDFTIANTTVRKNLKVKYSRVDDLCYNDFVAGIFSNPASWHKGFVKEEKLLDIPVR
jgi:hypothetical protein